MSNVHQEQQAIALYHNEGMSIASIMKATGLAERKVKVLTKGITKAPKVKKARKVVTKIPTTLTKAVDRVYPLAIRQQGIRDYELNDILHQEYGSTWDTTTGRYVSKYDYSTKKRVKEKVRLRAAQKDSNVLFVMDWVNEEAPTAGRKFLEAAAADLMTRIEDHANQYMELHATHWREDSEESDLAQRKQMWAVENHLLKMAVKGYGKEPLDMLLERSLVLTDLLEGTPDAPMTQSSSKGTWHDEVPEYYPEPTNNDPFLDHVESQGWLKEVEGRFL
jgi:hypothetical protein